MASDIREGGAAQAAATRARGSAAPGRRRGKGRGLVVGIVLVAVVAGAAGFAYSRMAQSDEPVVVPSETVAVGEFTTNLADREVRRIIQIDLTLSVAGTDGVEAVEASLPAVQDAVNTTLHTFTAEELGDEEGLARLREAIAQAVDRAAGGEYVRAVYLTRIVIQ